MTNLSILEGVIEEQIHLLVLTLDRTNEELKMIRKILEAK